MADSAIARPALQYKWTTRPPKVTPEEELQWEESTETLGGWLSSPFSVYGLGAQLVVFDLTGTDKGIRWKFTVNAQTVVAQSIYHRSVDIEEVKKLLGQRYLHQDFSPLLIP